MSIVKRILGERISQREIAGQFVKKMADLNEEFRRIGGSFNTPVHDHNLKSIMLDLDNFAKGQPIRFEPSYQLLIQQTLHEMTIRLPNHATWPDEPIPEIVREASEQQAKFRQRIEEFIQDKAKGVAALQDCGIIKDISSKFKE